MKYEQLTDEQLEVIKMRALGARGYDNYSPATPEQVLNLLSMIEELKRQYAGVFELCGLDEKVVITYINNRDGVTE